jgi:lipopolysaccharide/colanic/teichoic acid biosynthesis glycosyltransferase
MPDEGIERPRLARFSEIARAGGYIGWELPGPHNAAFEFPAPLSARDSYARFLKRGVDIVGAAIGLVLFLPLMVFVAAGIAWSDGLPILFTQERVGRDLHPFKMLKFRTMKRNAEAMLQGWKTTDDPLWHLYVNGNFKLSPDPRTMPFGKFLRRYSLDELPQLWNVLCGHMSLVGPRPLPRYQLEEAMHNVESGTSRDRHSVRPGITGLWQVSGRSHTNYAELLAYDLRYVVKLSFALDVVILIRTTWVVLRGDDSA